MSINELDMKVKELRELRRMDTGALKKALPEVAERFMKSVTSRRFVLA